MASLSLHREEREAIKSIKKFAIPYQLNIGSGTVKLNGWVNVDLEKVVGVTDVG